ESDGFSITSSLSRQSSGRPASSAVNVRIRRPSNTKTILKSKSLSNITGGVYTRPALRPSLFPNIPPTINFISENEKVELLPWEIRKLLKWRMSPITPNIVKSALARVGFRISKSKLKVYHSYSIFPSTQHVSMNSSVGSSTDNVMILGNNGRK
ncbi:hypothetical protein LOTGIDRAFT_176747, partial [Lottia gigantea]